MNRLTGAALGTVAVITITCGTVAAATDESEAKVDGSEVEHIPAIDVPPSVYISAEARKTRWPLDPQMVYSKENVAALRHAMEPDMAVAMEQAKELFPVRIERSVMAGVPVSVVTPEHGVPPENRRRALIELHPGAFFMGAGYGIAESAPIAVLSKMKVFSVEYRLTPENMFPAASEDVAKVYGALLKQYQPGNVGIYGCSAGGLLVAESLIWFQRHRMPRPGAAGILCSSADARFDGDSRYTNPASGFSPPPGVDEVEFMLKSYFGDVDLHDPLISPVWSPDALSRFPPTLILTSTRAHELSSAVFTHEALVKAGVVSDLHVWDGLPHGFFILKPELPESREAFDAVVKFFGTHLGHAKAAPLTKN
jgi:epsilon-lactone hydrolase